MPIGKCAREPRRDLGAIGRQRHDTEMMINHREVEACEMKKLGYAGIGQHQFQPRSLVLTGCELHEMGIPVARRELDETQSVAIRVQAHRLCVYGDNRPEVHAFGEITAIKPMCHSE